MAIMRQKKQNIKINPENRSTWKDQIKKSYIDKKTKKNVIVWIHNANKNAFTMDAIMNLSENNINHII
jgi:hypothetical protein